MHLCLQQQLSSGAEGRLLHPAWLGPGNLIRAAKGIKDTEERTDAHAEELVSDGAVLALVEAMQLGDSMCLLPTAQGRWVSWAHSLGGAVSGCLQ